ATRLLPRISRMRESSNLAAAERLSRSSGSQPTVYSRSRMRMTTGSLVLLLMRASRVLFQRLEAGDHRLHPGPCLLVLGQQLRPFTGELLVLLAQAAVLLGQALGVRSERLDALGEGAHAGAGVVWVHAGHDRQRSGHGQGSPGPDESQ